VQDPVLILGASGVIGGSIAKRLAKTYPVILHGRSVGRLRLLVNEIVTDGGNAEAYTADLSQSQQVESFVEQLLENYDRLSGIVFSVANSFPNKLTHNISWEVFSEQIDSQLKALHLSLRGCFPLLKDNDSGARVLVLSTEFVLGNPPIKTAPYIAAKAALTSYAKVLSQEWLQYGIRVHIIAPGMVCSSLTAELPARYIDQLVEGMPEKVLTSEEDVADIAAFLMTSDADTMYGTVIHVSRATRR